MSISAHGGKPKKGRKKKNQKAKPNPKQDNKQVEQQVQVSLILFEKIINLKKFSTHSV